MSGVLVPGSETPMSDVALMAGIAFACICLTSLFWILYGTLIADQMRTTQQERIARLHDEYEMQRRTYGAVPIEKLTGREQ